MNSKTWTAETIRENILKSDAWLKRAIIAIYERQTADEKASGETSHNNGVGFNGADSFILSSFAEQIKARGTLSPKQTEIARKKMPKYAKQLTSIANNK